MVELEEKGDSGMIFCPLVIEQSDSRFVEEQSPELGVLHTEISLLPVISSYW